METLHDVKPGAIASDLLSAIDPKGGHGKPQEYDPEAQKGNESDDCIAEQNASKKTPSGVADGRLVEIGAIRSSCDPCAVLVLKSVFEVVLGSGQGLAKR